MEKFSPAYWMAKWNGDEEEAQCIKEKYEALEERIPILRDIVSAQENFEEGNYKEGLLDVLYAGKDAAKAVATKGKSLIRDMAREAAMEKAEEGLDWFLGDDDTPTEDVGVSKKRETSSNSAGKHSGKNDKHINPHRKSSAQEQYESKKEEFKALDRKIKKTPHENKELEKLRRQLKHFYKKWKESGEVHSRKTKNKKRRRR